MTNQNLGKARKWADSVSAGPANARARAAAEIIRSLPDQWVDVEKVQEIIEQMNVELQKFGLEDQSWEEGYDDSTKEWKRRLEALLTPKLPTLADMSEEEREACQWMQAKIPDSDQIHVIANVWPTGSFLWRADGHSFHRNNALITPLPGPKLKWPGGEPVEKHGNASLDPRENIDASIEYIKKTTHDQQPNTSETPKSSIKPEDVPHNEPWLIEANGQKAIGTRYAGSTVVPWAVAALDGSFLVGNSDNEITLIHKLVPEPPALPEGMRLADHEEYGRVVTSPWVDAEDDYKIFFLNEDARGGADYDFAHESELTFLDGGN